MFDILGKRADTLYGDTGDRNCHGKRETLSIGKRAAIQFINTHSGGMG